MMITLTIDVTIFEVINGDTIRVQTDGGDRFSVRLRDVWAPELKTSEGVKCKEDLVALIESVYDGREKRCSLSIIVEQKFKSTMLNFMSAIRFERVVGVIYPNGTDKTSLNEMIVLCGIAEKKKPRERY